MKTLRRVLLACVASVGLATPAWAIDPMDAQSLQIRKFFINANASALTSGTSVVLDYVDTNLTTGASKNATSNLGLHVNTTTVSNSRNFVGVIHQDSCASQGICEVTVYGPEIALFECSTSAAVAPGGGLGTGGVAGQLISGTRAGIMLSGASVNTPSTNDGCLKWVFVNPSPGS